VVVNVAAPLIVAVHVHGNATVDVIETGRPPWWPRSRARPRSRGRPR